MVDRRMKVLGEMDLGELTLYLLLILLFLAVALWDHRRFNRKRKRVLESINNKKADVWKTK
jgi:predicted PurR-regulated permease PerM